MAQQSHQTVDKSRERQSSQAGRAESSRDSTYSDESQQGQTGQQEGQSQGQERFRRASMSIPVIGLRGLGRIYDIQATATRLLLQTQASTASTFGWPDYSGLFRVGDDRVRRIFSSGVERFLSLAEQANETASEIQREVGRMLESQAVSEAEDWQRGLDELGAQAEESLNEFRELARRQAEESIRAVESIGEESRAAIREGGQQFRENVRQGAEQGREMASRQEHAVHEQAEDAEEGAKSIRSAASDQERHIQKRKAS